jgi:hypothetical protein
VANFFPKKSYRTKEQWQTQGRRGLWQRPDYYPDESLRSLGAAYRLHQDSGSSASKIPIEMVIAQSLRENRPADYGLNHYDFSIQSGADNRTLQTLRDVYKIGNYAPPDIRISTHRPDRKDLVYDSSWSTEDKTQRALQALAILGNKVDRFGPERALTSWNGTGKGAREHRQAVDQQLEALNAFPEHKKNVFDAFYDGYNNPGLYTMPKEREILLEDQIRNNIPSLLNLFK